MAESHSTLHYVDPKTGKVLTPPTDFCKTSYAVFNPETGVASVHLVGRAGEDTVSDYLLDGPCEALLSVPENKLDEAVTELLNVSLKELADNTNGMVSGSCFTGNLHVKNRIYNANVGDCCGFTASFNEKTHAFFSSKGHKVNVQQLSTAVFNRRHIHHTEEKLLTDIEKIEKARTKSGKIFDGFTRSFGDTNLVSFDDLIREPAIGVFINDLGKNVLAFNASDGIAEILKLEEIGKCIQSFMESKSLKSFDHLDSVTLLELAIQIANYAKTVWPERSIAPCDDMSITIAVHNPKKPKFIFYNTNDGHGGTEVAEYIRKNFNNILSKHAAQVARKYSNVDEQKINIPAIATTPKQENNKYTQKKAKLALSLPEEDSATFDAGSSLQAYSILASSPTNANTSSEKLVPSSNSSGCCCTIL